MNFLSKYWSQILLAVAGVILFFALKGCSDNASTLSDYQDQIAYAKEETKTYKGKNGQLIAEKSQLQLENTNIFEEREDLAKKLANAEIKAKNVNSMTNIVTTTTISDPIVIELPGDSIPCDFGPIPFSTPKDSIHYTIKGTFSNKALAFTDINFPDTLTFTSYEKRIGFMKRKTFANVQHSNPYITTKGIESYQINPKKKWYQKTITKVAVGFVIGAYSVSKL